MEILHITLTRVFDVGRYRGKGAHTEFGFEAGATSCRSAYVYGCPRIESGDTLTVVLRRKDNWRSIVGWYNHVTGETVSEPIFPKPLLIAALFLFWHPLLVAEEPLVRRVVFGALLFCAQIYMASDLMATLQARSLLKKAKKNCK
jgi:hypothetical protein